ncbi:G2/M phase-specific E3 ubiquitin-protein ligase-like isoform X2 [Clarias gariepinus]|uniref:G2/M phase-specific E3 ubiquitin-protein ligase-like isoform X2 n=1 Tax=Clarias gariepinus TaxID=13013 RepID=UPI00234CC071|nr:G2/M phase-specific E3 ubiquitin-protein ligase-like isoform X2 [Clarias gariepinus]
MERTNFSLGKKRGSKQEQQKVQINVGIMCLQSGCLKPQRGKTLPLLIDPQVNANDILMMAEKKIKDFNKDMEEGPYVLLYPDGSNVINIPGTARPFTLKDYRTEIGKPYSRINLFICRKKDFEGEEVLSSESETEVVIRTRNTEPIRPRHTSTPEERINNKIDVEPSPGSVVEIMLSDSEDDRPSISDHVAKENQCYREYMDVYAPVITEEDDELVATAQCLDLPEPIEVQGSLTAPDIISNLALAIDRKRVSRFNIIRSNVWDGAVRGFKRVSYSEFTDMFVKFSDDAGTFEEGLDTGGPRRELLTLLMSCLQYRPIFDGPPSSRYLVYNSVAVREDEYFLAGKMIAVSIVHGGPGPHFLSQDLVNHIVNQTTFSATLKDVTDEGIVKALQEIKNAATLGSLQELILKNSTLLQTAGCFRRVNSIEEKHEIVEEYVKWYVIDRNHSVIKRFKDGLSTLEFLTALQKHPHVLTPFLYHTEKKLTASNLEDLFKPELSPAGSNQRQKESKTLCFWSDYLLDCEEHQTEVLLKDVLMFATGLTSLPPAGLTPLPSIVFLASSPFPMANTCTNTLKLPLLDTYSLFQKQMDFGIQNSPGFGCI